VCQPVHSETPSNPTSRSLLFRTDFMAHCHSTWMNPSVPFSLVVPPFIPLQCLKPEMPYRRKVLVSFAILMRWYVTQCYMTSSPLQTLFYSLQFTDPTSYQAIFYFLVIKPSVTLFLSIALLCIVPLSFALILPAPGVLRAVKRVGSWQASIAVEGLLRPRL